MSDIRKALEALESVLFDPEGKAAIHGSDADMKVIDDALDQLRALAQPQAAQPEAVARIVGFGSGEQTIEWTKLPQDLPVGTLIYATPPTEPAPQAEPAAPTVKQMMAEQFDADLVALVRAAREVVSWTDLLAFEKVRDLEVALDQFEPWLDQDGDDPRANGCVDDKGRP